MQLRILFAAPEIGDVGDDQCVSALGAGEQLGGLEQALGGDSLGMSVVGRFRRQCGGENGGERFKVSGP